MNDVRLFLSVLAVGWLSTSLSAEPLPVHWSLDVEGGYFGRRAEEDHVAGYLGQQKVFWTALGYRVNRFAQVGWEGGIYFPKSNQNTNLYTVSTLTQKAFYTGGYVQGGVDIRRVRLHARLGAGVSSALYKVVHVDSPPNSMNSVYRETQEYHVNAPAVVMATGIDWKMTKHFAIGIGMRDTMVFRYDFTSDRSDDSVTGNSDTRYGDRIKIIHVPSPFIRASLLF